MIHQKISPINVVVARNGEVRERGARGRILGRVLDPAGAWRATCRCGWRSPMSWAHRRAALAELLDHHWDAADGQPSDSETGEH